MNLPTFQEIVEVVILRNYNTRLVVLSTMLLGMASGLVGSFLLLRKRSLMGDTLSHACLPGIGIFFVIMVAAGGTGKALLGLLLGATLTGMAGIALVLLIRNTTRIKDDTAMGIVLSVFFGLGVAVLGMIQTMPNASAAGLETFIYGKAASMVFQDFILIASVASVILILSILLLKEFTLLSFDENFTCAIGWPAKILDIVMLVLVTAATVIGLQAVGLILIIALLIIPSAAARFWTNDLKRMLLIAGFIGGLSGWLGSSISALMPRLPAGAVIVLVAAMIFTLSMLSGTAHGVILRHAAHRRLQRKVGRQHLLRAVYEILESLHDSNEPVPFADVLAKRSWTPLRLRQLLARAKREDHLEKSDTTMISLSESGYGEAARTTRNHRLWETYLITHADVAPQHVDRDADVVEHVLEPGIVRMLEEKLAERKQLLTTPRSPHDLQSEEGKSS